MKCLLLIIVASVETIQCISRAVIETEFNKFMGLVTFSVGVNQFADRTEKELKKMQSCGWKRSRSRSLPDVDYYKPPKFMRVPDYWNWTAKGVVTEVKDQHHFPTEDKPTCGSCFAFSSIGAIEGQYAIKNGRKLALSEQNIVDCGKPPKYDMHGCHGGLPWEVYRYARDYGVQAQSTYPYTGREEQCKYNPNKVVARVKSFKMISPSEDHLKKSIYQIAPLSVCISLNKILINFYNGGIYYDPDCHFQGDWDHDVLAVGYGTTSNGEDYWIVKNSWGPDWGLQGYILMARNKDNNCGIASSATYPIM